MYEPVIAPDGPIWSVPSVPEGLVRPPGEHPEPDLTQTGCWLEIGARARAVHGSSLLVVIGALMSFTYTLHGPQAQHAPAVLGLVLMVLGAIGLLFHGRSSH